MKDNAVAEPTTGGKWNPTKQQQAAIEAPEKKVFCLAVAGSGKSSSLVARIKFLIQNRGVDPKKIISISFTNAAAKVLEERLGDIRIAFCGTIHSFLLKLLRQHCAVVGYKPLINVLDEESSAEFLERVSAEQKFTGTKAELLEAVKAGPPRSSERFTKARLVAAAYYKQLRSANLMTFDSILLYGYLVCVHLRDTGAWPFTHHCIDEVQDSGREDFAVYSEFVGELFMLGDDSQAIYGFRGGDVSLCLAFAKEAKVYPLEENFRCGSAICEAADRLIAHNTARYPKVTRSATGFPGSVTVREYSDPSVEAAGIANQIATSDLPRNDIAVLVRTNDLVSEYANHLRAVGIPVAERVVKPMPEDWPKARLLLQFLNNPDDDYVAEKWLACYTETHQVAFLKRSAAKEFKTLNQYVFKDVRPTTIAEVMERILKSGLTMESQSLIASLLSQLPSDSDITDLLLALGQHEQGEEMGHGVTVSTMHSSKGREWGMVFLPCMEQDILPSQRKTEDIQASRRLCYVAFTRAKHSLCISFSRVRVTANDRARQQRQPSFRPVAAPTQPSQFIAEAGLVKQSNGL